MLVCLDTINNHISLNYIKKLHYRCKGWMSLDSSRAWIAYHAFNAEALSSIQLLWNTSIVLNNRCSFPKAYINFNEVKVVVYLKLIHKAMELFSFVRKLNELICLRS